MTSHYIDLKLLPDPETGPAQLLGALYDRVHLALVQQRLDCIGVSFPGYSQNPRTLGHTLRLHGRGEALDRFMHDDWLRGMRDHVRLTSIAMAPYDALHRVVRRRQFKTSAARLRRRRMRRKGETAEQAAAAIPTTMEHRPTLPYVHLHSHSTQQPFTLFIEIGRIQHTPIQGHFNSYGLGGPATVPWF